MQLHHARGVMDLTLPAVWGVVNVTPDSFSDGGRYLDPGRACDHALRLVAEGAQAIDIGGESTRPGAADVPVDEELRRVLPVVKRLAAEVAVPLSVDTSRPEVIRAVLDEGASIINDIRALQSPGALQAAASGNAAVCLMHMQGEPRTMQAQPKYGDVFLEVRAFLEQRIQDCLASGIDARRIVIDPGFGFGKRLEHNLQLLDDLHRFAELRQPVLVGLSRKSMLQALTGRDASQRLAGSLALATIAVRNGAHILRAHDVAATVDAAAVAAACLRHSRQSPGAES